MKTLDEIAIEQQTDKASVHPTGGHDYARHYDFHFSAFRGEEIRLIEIGVGGGQSIRTWLQYFPNAKVYGVDNNQGTNPWNTVNSGIHSRYTFVYGDQSDTTFWKCFAVDYGRDWNVVIDDGGHYAQQVIATFRNLWPMVKSKGIYAVEDFEQTYSNLFTTPGQPTHMDLMFEQLHDVNRGGQADRLHFTRGLMLLWKK